MTWKHLRFSYSNSLANLAGGPKTHWRSNMQSSLVLCLTSLLILQEVRIWIPDWEIILQISWILMWILQILMQFLWILMQFCGFWCRFCGFHRFWLKTSKTDNKFSFHCEDPRGNINFFLKIHKICRISEIWIKICGFCQNPQISTFLSEPSRGHLYFFHFKQPA